MSRKRKSSEKLHQREQPEKLFAKNEAQAQQLCAIDNGRVIFARGCAGTGKTYLAVIRACELLYEGYIQKIVITRPNVETAKSLGALPGTLEEKLDPYVAHMLGMIRGRFSAGWLDCQIKNKNIEICALGYVQGATYDNSVIIVDEAEHLSPREMYIILTRIGIDSKMILCGDNKQKFSSGANGFQDAIDLIGSLKDVYVCDYTSDDIIRSDIVRDIVKRYEAS